MSMCLFSVSMSLFLLPIGLSVLFFLDSNICVNTRYLFFWLTSLYITLSRSLYGSANDTVYSFLWLSNILLCVCVCVCVCVPLCVYVIFHCVYAATAAKSLQSCPTLCDPVDGGPPGSSVPGILQMRILEWVAISFSNACMHAKSLQLCPTLCDPMTSSPPGSSVHRIL